MNMFNLNGGGSPGTPVSTLQPVALEALTDEGQDEDADDSGEGNGDSGGDGGNGSSGGGGDKERDKSEKYNLYFALINVNNGEPLAYFPYDIEMDNGIKIAGITDKNGNTELMISDKEQIAKISVYEPDVTPINPEWDA